MHESNIVRVCEENLKDFGENIMLQNDVGGNFSIGAMQLSRLNTTRHFHRDRALQHDFDLSL